MFGFNKKKSFKNDRELTTEENNFLNELADKLYLKYPLFKLALDQQIIIGIAPDPLGLKGSYNFTFDSKKWDKICDKSASAFSLEGVYAFDNTNFKQQIKLFTLEGILIGFYCAVPIKNLNLLTLNAMNSYEKHFINTETNEISEILNVLKPIENNLDLATTFKIKLSEDFYTIKNLENGNYLALNKKGEIFKLIHDPFEIKKMYDSISDFINSLNKKI